MSDPDSSSPQVPGGVRDLFRQVVIQFASRLGWVTKQEHESLAEQLNLAKDELLRTQAALIVAQKKLEKKRKKIKEKKNITKKLQRENVELEKRVCTDALTGLKNKAAFELKIQSLNDGACEEGGQGMTILFIDGDNFKAVNDSYGHTNGDTVLKELARRLTDCIRESDIVDAYRYGGEEFIVFIPGGKIEDSLAIAERLRKAVADEPFAISESRTINFTISIGLAVLKGRQDYQETVDLADKALAAAKLKIGSTDINLDRLLTAKQKESPKNRIAYFPGSTLHPTIIRGDEILPRGWSDIIRLLQKPTVKAARGRRLEQRWGKSPIKNSKLLAFRRRSLPPFIF